MQTQKISPSSVAVSSSSIVVGDMGVIIGRTIKTLFKVVVNGFLHSVAGCWVGWLLVFAGRQSIAE